MEKLNKRICKKCKSTRIAIDGDYVGTTYFKCETCGYIGDSDNFPKITNGDFIRQMSDEELAEMLVFEQVVIKNIQINDLDSSHNEGTYMKMWKSASLPTKFFDDKEKALAATIEELKKEVKDENSN